MTSAAEPPQIRLAPLIVCATMFACIGGCNQAPNANAGGKNADEGSMSELAEKLTLMNSASDCLRAKELDAFPPGREMSDVLADVKWRGSFVIETEIDGESVAAIEYEIFPDKPVDHRGYWVWALFIDGKFAKFVESPGPLPEDYERAMVQGKLQSRLKRYRAGDDTYLFRAMNSTAKTIEDVKKYAEAVTPPPPTQSDPGLTAAYLILRAIGAAPSGGDSPSEQILLRNAALRDQFNAVRLKIGMTESQVEAVLNAKPIESGESNAGHYCIYGSDEPFDLDDGLHFDNILVILQDGKAVVISGAPAGYGWRENLHKAMLDLKPTTK